MNSGSHVCTAHSLSHRTLPLALLSAFLKALSSVRCRFLLCCHCHCSPRPRLSTNRIQQSTNFIWDISNTACCTAYCWLEFSSHPQNRLTNSQHTYKFKKEILVLLCNWACDCSLHRACWPLQSYFISVSLYLTLYLPILFLSVNAGHLPVHQKCQRGCRIGITFTYRVSQLSRVFVSCWQWEKGNQLI